jgi:hypothetical protein
MPEALKSEKDGDNETYQGLPPYAKRKAFLMDKYPACPNNWLESTNTLSSYFVPVQEGKGMWLDFNKNANNSHEVAIVVSIQGVNPLTGLPCEDQQLEQYIECCPKCKTEFKPERLCESCGFKYPKQNYICTTGTPNGSLWLDGFRAVNGAVRQYLLTAEKMRGVASNVIGNDRVFAIGVSYFLSKDKKAASISSRGLSFSGSSSYSSSSSSSSPSSSSSSLGLLDSDSISVNYSAPGASGGGWQNRVSNGLDDLKSSSSTVGSHKKKRQRSTMGGQSRKMSQPRTVQAVQTKKLEVSAGANIKQLVYDDPEQLDFWRDTPEATICINYCLEDDAAKIIEAGEISLEGHKEGFLQSIPVGN